MVEFTAEQLGDIQGFILSAYAHLRPADYIFLQIRDIEPAREWLEDILPAITTSQRWPTGADGKVQKPDVTLNIGFTYSGFQKLGLPEDTLLSFTREFIIGMTDRADLLGDRGSSAPAHWTVGNPNDEPFDIILILNATTMEHLNTLRHEMLGYLEETEGGFVIVDDERGYRHPSEKEAFGFRDGITQPKVEHDPRTPTTASNVIPTGEILLGYRNGYNVYPPSPGVKNENDPHDVLPPYPEGAIPGYKDFGRNGTYVVYRKLHQNVATFWNYFKGQLRTQADHMSDEEEMVWLAAKCMGRWPSGAPLVLSPDHDDPEMGYDNYKADNFLYAKRDPHGFGCPIGSHVRRANPRDSRINEKQHESIIAINRHRIIRRATSFGEDLFPREDVEHRKFPEVIEDDGQERGLHFFALNASIRRQFELIQVQWANLETFNGLIDNKDPIIGDNDGSGHVTIPHEYGRRRLLNVPRFVETRGGGYFFMPSLTALRYLVSVLK